MESEYIKYYKEIETRLSKVAEGSPYIAAKLRDNRIESFLHFALYTELRFEYKRIGRIGKGGKRIRHGNSGTRQGTCDKTRIPTEDHPKGPPLPNDKIIRYYDKTRSRRAWRSFRRPNFIGAFAWLDDTTGKMTTNPADLVNSGQVPPPPLALSKGLERKVKRTIQRLKRKGK